MRHPTCRLSLPGDPALEPFGELGIDLARFLGEQDALEKTLATARQRMSQGGYNPSPPPPLLAHQNSVVLPLLQPVKEGPERAWITRDARGIWLGTTPLAEGRVKALAQILALLGHAATLDDDSGHERRFRNVEQLSRMAPGVKVNNVQTWVSRGREAISKATGAQKLGEQVIEARWGKGYRLGPRFSVRGMDVQEVFGGRS